MVNPSPEVSSRTVYSVPRARSRASYSGDRSSSAQLAALRITRNQRFSTAISSCFPCQRQHELLYSATELVPGQPVREDRAELGQGSLEHRVVPGAGNAHGGHVTAAAEVPLLQRPAVLGPHLFLAADQQQDRRRYLGVPHGVGRDGGWGPGDRAAGVSLTQSDDSVDHRGIRVIEEVRPV